MKKKLFISLLSSSLVLSAMNIYAAKQGAGAASQSESGSQTETVQFSAPLDMKSCLIGPVLLQNAASGSSGLSKADAEALVKALASVQAAVAGNVELSITRHGNYGSVHKAEFSGVMKNGQLAFLTTAVEAEGDAEADAYANTSASTNVGASTSTQMNISLLNIDWWDGAVKLFAGLQSSASVAAASQSASQSSSTSASSNDGGAAAATTSDSSSANEAAAHIVVEGANIDKFEGSLSMSGASLQSIDTEAVAEVIADAYASSYAASFASSYVQSSGSAAFSMGLHIDVVVGSIDWSKTVPLGQSYSSVYKEARAELKREFSALAKAQAEAVVKFLSSAELKVNLGVSFEDLPGNTDMLEATGNTSAMLTCDLSKSLSSSADVE